MFKKSINTAEYSAKDLCAVAAKMNAVVAAGMDTYLFFKHEETPEGALHAEELLRGL